MAFTYAGIVNFLLSIKGKLRLHLLRSTKMTLTSFLVLKHRLISLSFHQIQKNLVFSINTINFLLTLFSWRIFQQKQTSLSHEYLDQKKR